MVGWFDRPLLLAAWLVALVLVSLGARELILRSERRPRGLFLSALSFFVILQVAATQAGCASSVATQRRGSHHEAIGDEASTAATEEAAQDAEAASARELQLPADLALQGRWDRFRAFWQKLDRVEPPRRSSRRDPGPPGGQYAQALTAAEQQVYHEELAIIFGRAEQELRRASMSPPHEEALSPLTSALVRLAQRRIEHMGLDSSLMTRMMPPPAAQLRSTLIDEMEGRIDSLLKLSRRQVINEDLFRAGLQKVQDDVHLLAVVSLMDHHDAHHVQPEGRGERAWRDPAAWVRGFDLAHKRRVEAEGISPGTREVLDRGYRQIKERLVEVERLAPQLDSLVEALAR